MVSQFFQLPDKVKQLIFLFVFFQYYSMVSRYKQCQQLGMFSFSCWLLQTQVVWPRLSDPFISQNPRGFCASFSRTDSGLYIYHLFVMVKLQFLSLWEFFTSANADGFQLDFEWQQVSSSLQDSAQRECCCLDSLHPFRYFQVLQSLYQSFADCTKSTDYNWYNPHFHVPQFFF